MNTTTQNPDLLDMTLDDLADLPSTELFPNGSHKVAITFHVNQENKSKIRLEMVYVEAIELADATQVAPAVGDKNSIFFNLVTKEGKPNEFAQGQLKELLLALRPTFGGDNLTQVMENSKGAEVIVLTKIRPAKGEYDPSISIVSLAVA